MSHVITQSLNDRKRWDDFRDISDEEFETAIANASEVMERLLRAKRASYGPDNLAKFGDHGILVRTSDKLERLVHMHRTGLEDTEVNEGKMDAWMDIAGYALLMLGSYGLQTPDRHKAMKAERLAEREVEEDV